MWRSIIILNVWQVLKEMYCSLYIYVINLASLRSTVYILMTEHLLLYWTYVNTIVNCYHQDIFHYDLLVLVYRRNNISSVYKSSCFTHCATFQAVFSFLFSTLKPLFVVKSSFLEALNMTVFLWVLTSAIPWKTQ